MQASGDGFWELALSDGAAWFSEWFHARLRRAEGVKRPTLNDLRTILAPDTWEMLLAHLRTHLEKRTPFDTKFPVQLADGRIEWWHMRGSTLVNGIGHPVHVAGSVRDVSAEPRQI